MEEAGHVLFASVVTFNTVVFAVAAGWASTAPSNWLLIKNLPQVRQSIQFYLYSG